jgi:cyanophycin synthetase
VFEHDPITLLTEGLAYDRCWVGVVTDSEPVAGLDEQLMTAPEHRYKILRTQVDVVVETGVAVLNATDETVLSMSELCDGDVILYAADAEHPALIAHREAGKRVVFLRNGRIERATGAAITDGFDLQADLSPAARALPADVLLPAIAAAWALALNDATIRTGLETFANDETQKLVIA